MQNTKKGIRNDNTDTKFNLVKITHINRYYPMLKDFSDQSIMRFLECLLFERGLKWGYVKKVVLSLIEHGKKTGSINNNFSFKSRFFKKAVFLKMKGDKSKLKLMENQAPFNFAFNDEEMRKIINVLKNMLEDNSGWAFRLYERACIKRKTNITQFAIFGLLIFSTGMRGIDIYQLTALEMLFVFHPHLNKSRTASINYINKNGTLHSIRIPGYIKENLAIKEYFLNLLKESGLSVPVKDLSEAEETVFARIPLFTVTRTQLNYLFDKLFKEIFQRKRDVWLRWHAGRRWFVRNVCNYINSGESLNIAAKLVGHSSVKTTSLYKNNSLCNDELQYALDGSLLTYL